MLRDAARDLLLGTHCVGCARPGRLLCGDCSALLPTHPDVAWPSPTPPGLVSPFAAASYEGTVREMVLGHKERRLLALRRPLAALLARAVEASGVNGPLVLVPVPSRPATVRARGHDPTYSMTSGAAAALRDGGVDAVAWSLLRLLPGVADQAGLDAAERAANLSGSMACSGPALRRLARLRPRARIIVCDDVLTTGATLREAQRALEGVGLKVPAAAVVAATRRRGSESWDAQRNFR
jgi:predicted amidophosphoribosyltransferase